jgi:carbonic anhydrase/acetyltransferase-like protein (isoleucine patch superfamily)
MALIRAWGGKAPRLADSVWVADGAVIIGDVEIGPESSVWFGAVVRGDVNHIRVGARTNLQDYSVLHVTSGTHPTIVGDDVTLGHRATVMDGAVVGEDAMVAAGSLVPPGMVVPPGMLALGSPAKVKRQLTREEIEYFRRSAANYAGYAEQYRREGWSGR